MDTAKSCCVLSAHNSFLVDVEASLTSSRIQLAVEQSGLEIEQSNGGGSRVQDVQLHSIED